VAYPGYDSVIKRDTVAIGEILRLNGYDTSWFGKDHNTPQWVASQAGPFTDWPTGPIKGFDYYSGIPQMPAPESRPCAVPARKARLQGPGRASWLRRTAFSGLRPAFGSRLSGSRSIMDTPRPSGCCRSLLSMLMPGAAGAVV
jgi:arylsulfatase A-like enzyme